MNKNLSAKKWVVFTLVAFGVFMSTLDSSIVNIALPYILDSFNTKLAVVEWVIMIYLLTITSFLLGCGKLSDMYGHKRIYIAGLSLFAFSSLICGLSQNIYMLITSRAVQGFSSAMIMACTPALLVNAFPESERGKVFGFNSMVVSCGLVSGPVIGGFLINQYSWRMIFYINIPIGIIAAAGSFFVLGENKKEADENKFDIKGTITAAIATGCFLFAVTHGYKWGFTSFKFISFLLISLSFFVLFINNEKKINEPLINLKIFKNKMLSISSISSVLLFLILFVIIFLMPFYLIKAKGLDPKTAGYIMMVPFIFLFFLSPVSGRISDYTGSRILCATGFFFLFAGAISFIYLEINSSILEITLKLALVGIGTAIFTSPNSAALISSIPPEFKGIGGAVMATSRNLGMVLGIAFGGALFNNIFHSLSGSADMNSYTPVMEDAFIQAFRYTMKATAILAFISILFTFMRGKEKKRQILK
ncbi:MAG: MFS transporter [Deltaproteobacteria bacterium]|nr:MAG: MFS transporter [Deltaproteobacteria bacterium]